jgi:hypothetical protein
MVSMHQYNQNKTIRTDRKFSVSMVLIATVAILAFGSTLTMAMAHHDHHHDGGGSDNSGQNSGGGVLNNALHYCSSNLSTCWSILNGLAGLL